MNRNDIKAEGEQQIEINPTGEYRPMIPSVSVENWNEILSQEIVHIVMKQFPPNLRAWVPQEGTQAYFIYMWVKQPIDF